MSALDRRELQPPATNGTQNLADILERVLDKGIVIAGDIQINLLDIELLTIKLRLLVASVDKAQEIGISWWDSDPFLSGSARELEGENKSLKERVQKLEEQIDSLSGASPQKEFEDGSARQERTS